MRRYRMTGRRRTIKVFCFFLSAAFVTISIVGIMHLRNLLGSLAVTRVSNTVGQMVTEAVSDTLASGEIQYDRLISMEKDNNGQVAALQSNMAEFNRLQSAITQDILKRLEETSDINLSIPMGTLTGSPLLAGRGPDISVRVQSTGSCSAYFENEFENAGINQTTHRILLCVDVCMSILLPGFRTSAEVTNAFAVAETVIVGAVPESYTYFDAGEPVEESAYEYSLNNG